MATTPITERVKSFEDACNILGINPASIEAKYPADVLSTKKLFIIARALNEGWTPDWKDYDQRKLYPWFEMDGLDGFSFVSVGDYCTASHVGSRLCFKNSDLVRYTVAQFPDLYQDMFCSLDAN